MDGRGLAAFATMVEAQGGDPRIPAPQTAGVLSAIAATDEFAGIPLSYITNGQQVPDDIATADAETLLSRLLPAKVIVPQMEAA